MFYFILENTEIEVTASFVEKHGGIGYALSELDDKAKEGAQVSEIETLIESIHAK